MIENAKPITQPSDGTISKTFYTSRMNENHADFGREYFAVVADNGITRELFTVVTFLETEGAYGPAVAAFETEAAAAGYGIGTCYAFEDKTSGAIYLTLTKRNS